jgi:hypothetical protein
MVLFVWGLIFVFALIPGALVGLFIGLIPAPTGLRWMLLVAVSAVASFVASRMIYKGVDLTTSYHLANLLMFQPPILLALMLGMLISRAKPPQPG